MSAIAPHKAKLLAENRIRWELGLNDPSFGGWTVTAGYLGAAVLALLAARRSIPNSFERRAWALIGAALLLLGINKQLDLHILAIDLGRALALDGGWYEQRRLLQRAFMAGALLVAMVVAAAGYWATRGRDGAIRLALSGLGLTAVYALARAAAFNHALLAESRWSWIVELGGIAVIAFAVRRYHPRG